MLPGISLFLCCASHVNLAELQSGTKLVEKNAQKALFHHFCLMNSTADTSPPPTQCWLGKCWFPGNCSWPPENNIETGRGVIVCLHVHLKALGRVVFLRGLSTTVAVIWTHNVTMMLESWVYSLFYVWLKNCFAFLFSKKFCIAKQFVTYNWE